MVLLTAAGCSRPVARFQLPEDVPETFSREGTAEMPRQWWQAFNDPALNELVEQALAENLNLQTTWDRLAQVQAVAERANAVLWPSVQANAGASRLRADTAGGVRYAGDYSVGVAAGYEVDLWSRLRSSTRAAWLDVQAQRQALDTAAISLSALAANTWYQLAEAKGLMQIAEQQVRANRQVLEIVTVQYQKGQVPATDVLRQRQFVAATESLLITARETIELLQQSLSVLIGAPPTLAWDESRIELPELPPPPSLGIPAQVLWRRPDVRQAYRQIQAADQRLAVAVADQYPRLSLAANAEVSSTSVRDLFDDSFANLAANAVQPLFDAGLRRAEVRRVQAVVSEAIHAWRQTILESLQEVETALTQERQQAMLLENLQAQLGLARETYDRTRDRYIKGQTDYIRVLESLQSLQSLERDLIRARRVLLSRRIDLYRSIAGGWELPAPMPVEVSDLNEVAAAAGRDGQVPE
jgi:NodT family efflux transporter outer membrane factor (OMF) lipoprotein